jgi:Arc/MetJ-type ribon-helix-helix transcriptional regulator
MAAPIPLSFRWPAEFVQRIDLARGDRPRSEVVRAAVEAWLAGERPALDAAPVTPTATSAERSVSVDSEAARLARVAARDAAVAEREAARRPAAPARGRHLAACRCAVCRPGAE